MSQDELARLLARVAMGDRAAFKALYDATSSQIMGLLVPMLGDRPAAEDVLQDTYLKVWHRAADYHGERGQVTTWLASIARYRALDMLRARKVRGETRPPESMDDEPVDSSGDAGQSALAMMDDSRLNQCLETLSGDQRQSIGLAYFRGFTHEEMATQLSIPLGTIKAWIRRGLVKLRECLES